MIIYINIVGCIIAGICKINGLTICSCIVYRTINGYNNLLDNFGFGAAFPSNSNQTNTFYEDGKLSFEADGWIPAAMGIWYFPDGITLAPGEQIVVAINSAIIQNCLTKQKLQNYYTK